MHWDTWLTCKTEIHHTCAPASIVWAWYLLSFYYQIPGLAWFPLMVMCICACSFWVWLRFWTIFFTILNWQVNAQIRTRKKISSEKKLLGKAQPPHGHSIRCVLRRWAHLPLKRCNVLNIAAKPAKVDFYRKNNASIHLGAGSQASCLWAKLQSFSFPFILHSLEPGVRWETHPSHPFWSKDHDRIHGWYSHCGRFTFIFVVFLFCFFSFLHRACCYGCRAVG